MLEALSHGLGLLAALLAAAGAVLAVLAARAVARLPTPGPAGGPALAASVLKPLYGVEPGLAANLASACAQEHGAPFEVLFAVQDPADPAAPVAEAAMAAAPAVPSKLVRDPRLHGPNRKMSQFVNLEPVARHGVLVAADADLRAPPGWLASVAAPLADPSVGLVTCLFRGEPADDGLWSRLAALGIDWQFLPNAALGEAMGRADGCYGPTMAIRRETLARLGGFTAFVDLLADDYELGAAVRRLGLKVAIAPVLPAQVMWERSLSALLAQEIRWARTLRLVDPGGYLGMGLTFPLAPGLLAAALAPAPWGWAALALALAARLGLAVTVDRRLGRPLALRRLALLPLRDLLSFAIWAAGLARGTVLWRGRRFRTRPDGSMVEAELKDRPRR